MKKAHLYELDLARIIGAFAVIIIHSFSPVFAQLEQQSSVYWLYVILSSNALFAVPLFFILSGFSLTYNRSSFFTIKELPTFYRKRLFRILVPYIILSILYTFILQFSKGYTVPEIIQSLFSFNYFKILLVGNSYFHLYFLVVLIQFYLIFPLVYNLLFKLTNRFRILGSLFFFCSLFILQWFLWDFNQTQWHFSYFKRIFIYYGFAFFFGMFLALYYERISVFFKSKKGIIITVILFIPLASVHTWIKYHHYIEVSSGLTYELQIFVWQVFSIMATLLIIVLSSYVAPYIIQRRKHLLIYLSQISFAIYLFHPAILFFYRKFIPLGMVNYHLYIFLGFASAIFGTIFLIRILQRVVPYSDIILGIPKMKK